VDEDLIGRQVRRLHQGIHYLLIPVVRWEFILGRIEVLEIYRPKDEGSRDLLLENLLEILGNKDIVILRLLYSQDSWEFFSRYIFLHWLLGLCTFLYITLLLSCSCDGSLPSVFLQLDNPKLDLLNCLILSLKIFLSCAENLC
jgi:hypothetical protein